MTAVTVKTGRCRECGSPSARQIPDNAPAFMRDLMDRAPHLCDQCCERLDAEAARANNGDGARARRQAASGVPTNLATVTFDHLTVDAGRADGIAAATRWGHGEIAGLLISGPVGAGKTRAAAAAANVLMRRRAVRWMSTPLLFARLGSGFGSRNHDDALDALTGNHALVLDDIDKARPTPYGAEQLFVAIDTRIDNNLPLLITSNLLIGEIARLFPDPFGEAIASRVAGYCEMHTFDSTDRRIKDAA